MVILISFSQIYANAVLVESPGVHVDFLYIAHDSAFLPTGNPRGTLSFTRSSILLATAFHEWLTQERLDFMQFSSLDHESTFISLRSPLFCFSMHF